MTVKSDVTESPETEGETDTADSLAAVDARLETIRTNDARRRAALAGAILAGLALAWMHWAGLVVAGALVGLTRRRLRGAVAAGAAFGGLAVALTVVTAPAVNASEFAALTPLNYATVGLGLLLPVWGSLARYVV